MEQTAFPVVSQSQARWGEGFPLRLCALARDGSRLAKQSRRVDDKCSCFIVIYHVPVGQMSEAQSTKPRDHYLPRGFGGLRRREPRRTIEEACSAPHPPYRFGLLSRIFRCVSYDLARGLRHTTFFYQSTGCVTRHLPVTYEYCCRGLKKGVPEHPFLLGQDWPWLLRYYFADVAAGATGVTVTGAAR